MRKATDKPTEHAVLLRLPAPLKDKLDERAKGQHRSTVGHLRYLIERDLEKAA